MVRLDSHLRGADPIHTMNTVLALPEWAQVALVLSALATAMGFLYMASIAATRGIELHLFKVRVITLRNQQVRRLEALMSGNDPDGTTSAMFDEVENVDKPEQPAAQQAA